MIRSLLLLFFIISFAGCRAERPAEVIELAASPEPVVAKAEPDPPNVDAAPAAKRTKADVGRWMATPPYDGKPLRMERIGRDRLRMLGEEFALEIPLPRLGECVEELPELPTPPGLPEATVTQKPAWLALQGDEEAASIRLGTQDALLVVNDGCMRVADITHLLLHTEPAIEDPVFTLEVEPENAGDTNGVKLRRASAKKARIVRDKRTLLELDGFFSPETMLIAREHEGVQWLRVLMSREWEYARDDGTSGRDHTLVWSLDAEDQPFLVLDNDYRYGLDGRDREERNITSTRAHQHPAGVITAAGSRRMVEHSARVGDECEDLDGQLLLRDVDESVSWSFRPEGARKPVTLGTARTRAVYSTGCVDVARKEVKRKGLALAARAIKSRVSWRVP